MKVMPVASPHAIAQPISTNSPTAQSARAKAISMLSGQPEPQAVQNQTAVQAEEMSAIIPPPQRASDSGTEVEDSAQPAEEAPEETVKPPEKDPALSRQFAQLARQEKALRAKALAQDQAIKAREAAIAAREAELSSKYKQPDYSNYIPKDRLQQDPLSVLAEANISYDALTQQLINQQPTDPRVQATISKLEAKVAQMEAQAEEARKAQAAGQDANYKAAVNQILADAKRTVFTDPAFETIKATNSVNDVVELITETFNTKGVILTVEEACQEVEDYLVEEATKLAKLSKIQKRLQSNSSQTATRQAQKTQDAQPTQQKQPGMRTLTNAASSQRQLSAKERAILAFKGELPK